jgi:arylsulfatase A-like enzyme
MFLYVHDIRPHDPYQAPVQAIGENEPVALALRRSLNRNLQRYRKLTKVDFDAGRPVGQTDNAETQRATMSLLTRRRELIETLYDAEVRAADTIVGEIIAELRRLGRWENTLFVLTSDHGEEFAEHDGWQHDQSLYQELIRVPLIVRLPAGEGAGLRVAAPVSLIDLVATVGDLLGRPEMREHARGQSWLPSVRGSATATADTSPSGAANGDLRIVAERHDQKKFFAPFVALRGHRNVAIRDGSWKAIWNIEPDTLELYELSTDPGEKRDRSADSPARANAMKQAARNWLAACPTPQQPVPKGPIDPADEQQLRALGYID